jgi:uncharacterized protein
MIGSIERTGRAGLGIQCLDDAQVAEHLIPLRALHRKYRDRAISLADACIVRMAELFERHLVFTLDPDFSVYRRNGREPLDLIFPSHG